jgi:predicted DNA-binding ribbon-helix-helix protein
MSQFMRAAEVRPAQRTHLLSSGVTFQQRQQFFCDGNRPLNISLSVRYSGGEFRMFRQQLATSVARTAPEARGRLMGYFMDQFKPADISPIRKRSIEIDGHRTSVSLEDAFWTALKKIAATRDIRTAELIATINRGRAHSNLSSAIRLFVLHHYREQSNSGLPYVSHGGTKHVNLPSLTAAERWRSRDGQSVRSGRARISAR